MQLEIESGEKELLVRVLESALRETRTEARHTETNAYRDGLHAEEATMRALLEKLRATG